MAPRHTLDRHDAVTVSIICTIPVKLRQKDTVRKARIDFCAKHIIPDKNIFINTYENGKTLRANTKGVDCGARPLQRSGCSTRMGARKNLWVDGAVSGPDTAPSTCTRQMVMRNAHLNISDEPWCQPPVGRLPCETRTGHTRCGDPSPSPDYF